LLRCIPRETTLGSWDLEQDQFERGLCDREVRVDLLAFVDGGVEHLRLEVDGSIEVGDIQR